MHEGTSSGTAFEDPLSAEIQSFLQLAVKSAKGIRVYAANNAMLRRHMEGAYAALARILEQVPELTLTVREDRLLYGRDAVYVNADRGEGLPFVLYRNAFRRVAFVRGFSREELEHFLSAVISDDTHAIGLGEDLVSALWRRPLPNLRYLTIDALASDAKQAESESERSELERIQQDIEGIVARLYKTSALDDEIVPGVSITREDLEALKDIREELPEDLDLLDAATERAIGSIDPADLEAMRATLLEETPELLSRKLLDLLVLILFKEQSSKEFTQTADLIQQLFDALLVETRYLEASLLIQQVEARAASSEDPREKHIARHLVRVFATEARVAQVLNALNDNQSRSLGEALDFLRALGPSIVPHLIQGIDALTTPVHRRRVVELILEHGVPDAVLLQRHMTAAKGLVARDILHLARGLPLTELAPIVVLGLDHENPRVREHAVGQLRAFPPEVADGLIVRRLDDADADVRLAALRLVAGRRIQAGRPALEVLLLRDDFPERDAREQRTMAAVYAEITGADGVPVLEKVLAPALFSRPRTTDAQIAAAFALGSIGTPAAVAAIQRGVRTLNPRVREACKRALGRDPEKTSTADLLMERSEGEDV